MLVIGLLLATGGCASNNVTPEPPRSFAQFLDEAYQLPDGRLIVDQDILVASAELARTYYEREMSASRARIRVLDSDLGARHDDLTLATLDGEDSYWPFPERMHLTYCVDETGFGTNAGTLIDALERATRSWHRRAGVFFERVDLPTCNNSTPSVVFNVRSLPSAPFNAAAFFPFNGRVDRELLVADSAFTPSAGGRDLEGILRHELGHVLGFRHEHIWLTPTCTGEGPAETVPEGSLGGRQLTSYDVDSVMHYPQCRPSGTGGYRQSELDYRGAISFYGLAPALFAAL